MVRFNRRKKNNPVMILIKYARMAVRQGSVKHVASTLIIGDDIQIVNSHAAFLHA